MEINGLRDVDSCFVGKSENRTEQTCAERIASQVLSAPKPQQLQKTALKAAEMEDCDQVGRLPHLLKRTHSNSNLEILTHQNSAKQQIAQRSGHMWEAKGRKPAPHGGYIYHFQFKSEFTDKEKIESKTREIYPAVEPETMDLLDQLPQALKQLGYRRWMDSDRIEHCELPDRVAILNGWKKLQESISYLPDLCIHSDHGIASNTDFVEAAFTSDVLLSDGIEFVHDQIYHVTQTLNALFFNRGFMQRRAAVQASILKDVRFINLLRKRILKENRFNVPSETLKSLEAELSLFETALGYGVDLLSASAWRVPYSLTETISHFSVAPGEEPGIGDYLKRTYTDKGTAIPSSKELQAALAGAKRFIRRYDQALVLPMWRQAIENMKPTRLKYRKLLACGPHQDDNKRKERCREAAKELLTLAKDVKGAEALHVVKLAKATVEYDECSQPEWAEAPPSEDPVEAFWLEGALRYVTACLKEKDLDLGKVSKANAKLSELSSHPHRISSAAQLQKLLENADFLLDKRLFRPQLSYLSDGIGPDGAHLIRQLLDMGYSFSEVDQYGHSALLHLTKPRTLPVLAACVEQFPERLDLETHDDARATNSVLATTLENFRGPLGSVVEHSLLTLVHATKDLDSKAPGGWTALQLSLRKGLTSIVRALVEEKATVSNGILKQAYESRSPAMLRLAIELLPSHLSQTGEYVLRLALQDGREEQIKILLDQGIEPRNMQDLCKYEHWDIAERLVRERPTLLKEHQEFRKQLLDHALKAQKADLVSFIQQHTR